ncbi:MAG: DUF3737 family protein [Bacteroidales bacterium]|nr:DUF3737 family protein [Bacteroidales bacterium]
MKELISNAEFGGERPLYNRRGLRLEDVTVHAGESALKETADIEAVRCRFEGKYPFWCCEGFTIRDCVFTEGARAALWYSSGLLMEDTLVEAPKMFREMSGLTLRRVRIPNALETLWSCKDIELEDVSVEKGDYLFMHSSGILICNLRLQGNYSFQYCKDVEIHDSVLHTKDAFWETENITVYDSEIDGEYLGWYSRNLRLVNCRIAGTQPLCYADGLILENCTFAPDADLAFEYSSVHADMLGPVTSVKNPRTGRIVADSYGEIILDSNIKAPCDCQILLRDA